MRSLSISVVAAMMAFTAPKAEAREPWQLGHGPFLTASDVREHNKAALDWRDLRALVAGDKPDWAAALQLYGGGRHFANHSLGIVADDYNGRFATVLPLSSRHFGTPSFQVLGWTAALMKTGRFRRASDAERVAFLAGAAPALMINWSRYELGEADRKAKASSPNWALTNGAPKNWNEIFAFYFGPEGKDSVFEAVEAAGASALNQQLMAALSAGQVDLLAKAWPETAAGEVRRLLDRASLVVLRQALASGLDADPALARQRAAGAWYAAAEAALSTPELAAAVTSAMDAKADKATIEAVIAAIDKAIAR